MVKFYAKKIRNGEIIQNTGVAWTVEDVPYPWRDKVEKELSQTSRQ